MPSQKRQVEVKAPTTTAERVAKEAAATQQARAVAQRQEMAPAVVAAQAAAQALVQRFVTPSNTVAQRFVTGPTPTTTAEAVAQAAAQAAVEAQAQAQAAKMSSLQAAQAAQAAADQRRASEASHSVVINEAPQATAERVASQTQSIQTAVKVEQTQRAVAAESPAATAERVARATATSREAGGGKVELVEGAPVRQTRATETAAREAQTRPQTRPQAARLNPGNEERPSVPKRDLMPNLRPSWRPSARPDYRPSRPDYRPGGPVVISDQMPDHWPIHLTSSVLLSPGAAGQNPPLEPLRAPQGRWLVIDEIKFEVRERATDNPDSAMAVMVRGMGSVIGCKLHLGREAVTGGFVPVSMFSHCQKQLAELVLAYVPPIVNEFIEEYSWKPPEKIIVNPGETLVPMFEHRGFISYKVRATVSYRGHLEKIKPDSSKLPYVVSWSSPAISLSGTESEQVSSDRDLLNPWEVPFNVEYMIGRAYFPYQYSEADTAIVEGNDYPTSNVSYPRSVDQTKIKITNSWGSAMVPKHAPYPSVFDLWSRRIEAPHQIPPGGFYTVSVKTGGLAVTNTQAIFEMSIIGWREVSP